MVKDNRILQYLVKNGYKILRVTENLHAQADGQGDYRYSWWVADTFEAADVASKAINDQFNIVEGLEITDFVNLNRIHNDEQSMLSMFRREIESDWQVKMRMKFSSNTKWKLYFK